MKLTKRPHSLDDPPMPKRQATPYDAQVDAPRFPGRKWMSRYLRVLEDSRGHLRATTRAAYESVWRSYLVYLASERSDAMAATTELAESFLRRQTKPTAQRYCRLLTEVYSIARQEKAVAHNPFTKLTGFLSGHELRAPSVALEIATTRDFIRALPDPDDWQEHRDQAAIILGLGAGLRLRELRELVMTQFVPTTGGLQVQPAGRTARAREVLLDRATESAIQDWLARRRQLRLKHHTDLVFPSRTGLAIPPNTFYRRVRRMLQQQYGEALPHFGVGVLRAGFAQRFKASDELVKAQHALGHRRITSTLRLFRHLKSIELRRPSSGHS